VGGEGGRDERDGAAGEFHARGGGRRGVFGGDYIMIVVVVLFDGVRDLGGSFEGEKTKAGRRESIVEMEIDEWDFP
jgi:hypothetical protein